MEKHDTVSLDQLLARGFDREGQDEEAAAMDRLERDEWRTRLTILLATLPARQRQILLCLASGMTQEQTAREVGCGQPNVVYTLDRVRALIICPKPTPK